MDAYVETKPWYEANPAVAEQALRTLYGTWTVVESYVGGFFLWTGTHEIGYGEDEAEAILDGYRRLRNLPRTETPRTRKRHREFKAHLAKVSAHVATWPAWAKGMIL